MGQPFPGSRDAVGAAAVAGGALFAVGLPGWWPLVPGLGLLVLAWAAPETGQAGESVGLAALCWGSVGVAMAASFGLIWPIPPAIGLGVAAGIWHLTGPHRPVGWLSQGIDDRTAHRLAVATVPLTAAALVAFIASGRTDIDAATEGLQGLPVWLVLLAGVGFIVVNPTVEEVLFRGVLQTALTASSGSAAIGVIVQAIVFGAIHLNGVPGGALGILMAGSWGIALGIVRHRTNSIRLPWLVHVVANIAIFASVAVLGHRDGVL